MHKWIYLYLAISFFVADINYNMDLNYNHNIDFGKGYIGSSIFGLMWPFSVPTFSILLATNNDKRWSLGKHD